MAEPIAVRDAGREDLPQILDLMRSSLGETPLLRREPELFAWKHYDNPFGESIILVAETAGRIVGLRAFMRWSLAHPEGGELRCVRAVDTATHPDFQGQGIFRNLTMSAVERARDDGVRLIFNTPNEKSAPGYLKMGWKEVGWVDPLVRPRFGGTVTPDREGRIPLELLLPSSRGFQPGDVTDRPPRGLRTRRTVDYQSWRFGDHPRARYVWWPDADTGGAVVRGSTRSGRVELLVSELTGGVECLRSLARQHRARYMGATFSVESPEYQTARHAGMFRPPGVKGLRLVANALGEMPMNVFDLSSWDLALSDLELL